MSNRENQQFMIDSKNSTGVGAKLYNQNLTGHGITKRVYNTSQNEKRFYLPNNSQTMEKTMRPSLIDGSSSNRLVRGSFNNAESRHEEKIKVLVNNLNPTKSIDTFRFASNTNLDYESTMTKNIMKNNILTTETDLRESIDEINIKTPYTFFNDKNREKWDNFEEIKNLGVWKEN